MIYDTLLPLSYSLQTKNRGSIVGCPLRDGKAICELINGSHSIDSLWKLHQKAKTVDAFFDARIEPNSSRVAWNEIRDNVERGMAQYNPKYDPRPTSVIETQARQAFLNTLTVDVINPLTTLKVNKNYFSLDRVPLVLTYPKGNAGSHTKAGPR